MRLRSFGRLLGAQIVAHDYLDIHTASQPERRLKFRPGEKFLIQDCGHPFRLGPVEITVRSALTLLKLLMATTLNSITALFTNLI